MRSMRSAAVGCVAVAFAAAGCGRLADGTYTPAPLAVLRGSVTQLEGKLPSGVSLAMFWYPSYEIEYLVNGLTDPVYGPYYTETCDESVTGGTCDGTPLSGGSVCRWAYDLPDPLVRAAQYEEHIGSFALPILDLPPAGARVALSRQGGSGTFALGYVVAFLDEDGDGAFRLGTPRRPPEPVVANSVSAQDYYQPPGGLPRVSYFVAFLDGFIDPEGLGSIVGNPPVRRYEEVLLGLPQGFSIWRTEMWTDTSGPLYWTGMRRRAMPSETPIDLFTLPGPDLSVGCTAGTRETLYRDAIPPGLAPYWCTPALDVARWQRDTVPGACATLSERYAAGFSCTTVPPPAWDCPVRGGLRIRVGTGFWSETGNLGEYQFRVRSGAGEPLAAGALGPNDDAYFERFPAGDHAVELDVAPGCAITTAQPVAVAVVPGETAEVVFLVECGAVRASSGHQPAGGAAPRAASGP